MASSTNFSILHTVSKGNSTNLLKIGSKRRRGKAQIEEEKKQDYKRKAEVEAKLAAHEDMKQQIFKMQA